MFFTEHMQARQQSALIYGVPVRGAFVLGRLATQMLEVRLRVVAVVVV